MKDETIAKLLKVALVVGGISALAPMVVNAQGIGVRELQKMMIPTPQKIERGEELYQQNCAVCHGKQGEGMEGVKLADAPGKTFQTTDFTEAEYRYGGGPAQIYNAITYGLSEAVVGEPPEGGFPPHPKYQHLQYQSRWDIAHYVRSLGPTDQITDPQAILEIAKERAIKGVCDPEIKKTVSDKVTPKGEEQLARGKELYDQQCVSCHGADGKGDGPAAAALQPPPRNFHVGAKDRWTNEPSPLGIFNTLQQGIEGTSMASYANLPEEDLWALSHYVLTWVPEQVEVESGEEGIVAACRALSAPDKPASVPVDVAMKALANDQVEDRVLELAQYGPVRLHPDADPSAGEKLYVENCVSCHGVSGSGQRQGPYGAQPPYLYLKIDRLVPAQAGGTAEEFAERSYAGVHATLPSMTAAAMLTKEEWRDLQAYVTTLESGKEGEPEIMVEPREQPAVQEALGLEPGEEPAGDAQTQQPGSEGEAEPAEQQNQPANPNGQAQ